MMYMVRKQLYLSEAQDQALKHKAAEDGVSEAEVVRRALDQALNSMPSGGWRPGRNEAIEGLKRTWTESTSALSEAFDRESLYEDRLDRQFKRD